MKRSVPATCLLCEAACGIVVEVEGEKTVGLRGDANDPQSRGYVCPKVVGMQDLHEDGDRLRTPMVRDNGKLREASWEEALTRAAEPIRRIRKQHGKDALAIYQGNPTAHNLGLMTFGQAFLRTMGTRNLYSASSTDQVPHMLAAHFMFGHLFLMGVPDIDRTEHLWILGANPAVSNGSIMTAPDIRRRIEAIRSRGGRVTVIDPRRTETAKLADEHVFLKPGTDPAFLLSVLHVIFAEGIARPGTLIRHLRNLEELRHATREYSPEAMAPITGIDAETTRRLARAFAAADRAVCYGRVGVCQQTHGTLAAWLVYALNAVTGNMDREGGMMWASPAIDPLPIVETIGLAGYGRYKSRVRGAPEVGGELPVACLAEEIETPGKGQIRALITSAGNPVLSAPNGPRIDRALASLEHLVCIDSFLNETSRHAHVILPPVSPMQRAHYDLALNAFSVRNQAKWSEPVLAKGSHERHDWEIFLELGQRIHARRLPFLVKMGTKLGVEGLVDIGLRVGEYKLSLAKLRQHPHGLDLGPLRARFPEMLRTRGKKVDVAPKELLAELPGLRAWLEAHRKQELVLIGRRHLRSNNSWLHNSARLVKGRSRCTMQIHPRDAEARDLHDGAMAEVETDAGRISIAVEITEDVMPGVVSIPHGFGHDRAGTRTAVATAHAGVSVNDITDDRAIDALSGNAAFSGLAVRVRAVAKAAAAE
ncbi:MAG: molybdopterin-dependent oxidoreductase [Polyangiales bacterium]